MTQRYNLMRLHRRLKRQPYPTHVCVISLTCGIPFGAKMIPNYITQIRYPKSILLIPYSHQIYLLCAMRVFNQIGILNPPTNPSNSLPNSISKASSVNPKLLFPSILTFTNSSNTRINPSLFPFTTTICRVGTCNNLYTLLGNLPESNAA